MGLMSKSKSDKLIKVNNLLDAALEGKVENLPELKQAKKLLTKVLEGKALETQGEYKVENHRDIKDKQLEIITHYGMENQLGQLVEECAEVIQVICKWGRYNKSEVSIDILCSLIEELGDIKNIIEQLELNSEFIKEGIQRNIINKVDRELERISKKENNLDYKIGDTVEIFKTKEKAKISNIIRGVQADIYGTMIDAYELEGKGKTPYVDIYDGTVGSI